ncbi:MAG: dihydrofolate reductase [Hyphomicrobiaceae bacterium]
MAAAENGVIGRGGALPWRMPADLKAFRRLTLGKPVVMGRRTFESIGRPLDGRDNVVITRGGAVQPDVGGRLHVAADIAQAIALGRRLAAMAGVHEVMVIGGAEIYRSALPFADRIYLTRIHAMPEGDATFSDPDPDIWAEVSRDVLPRGNKDEHDATLVVYERRDGHVRPDA